ncbi:hypothetical protein AAHZ94_21595 [Streptomyces sp. HSW2009]|uniref:hypothetical protein n=1 Tax=Streptomyces sp. HSW2009 TaxID=3142890 RepID=UPI0032EC2EB6
MATLPCAPDEGPARMSFHEVTGDAACDCSDQGRAPRYVTQRESERRSLRELIAANEELHGPLTAEEIRTAEAKMFGDGANAQA